MSNLSVVPEIKVETSTPLAAIVISSSLSTAIGCLRCGQPKGVYSYTSTRREVIFTIGPCLCTQQNAPSYGGVAVDVDGTSALELEERRLLSDLYKCPSLKELYLAMPLPTARSWYSARFRDMLEGLIVCQDIKEARAIMELYASAEDMMRGDE